MVLQATAFIYTSGVLVIASAVSSNIILYAGSTAELFRCEAVHSMSSFVQVKQNLTQEKLENE